MAKVKYVNNYRWYVVLNYIVALVEQILLWNYASRTFFWIALIFNMLGFFIAGYHLSKLEKPLEKELFS